ncbi:MAG: glutathione S-transferase family protein [Rubrivivax sp.]|nr:MAG: glutathione S-transferase family protein [Rubrivivax sp.]
MPVATPTRPAARARKPAPKPQAATATLTLSSKNYSSWSLRGWLLTRFAGLAFEEVMVSPDDEDARKELLLLAPSIRVPCLRHEGVTVWNNMAIAEYLNETFPKAGLWPADRIARAQARAVCGEMNSGFANLRSALPMNLKGRFPKHKIWTGAKPDIERIIDIWSDCLATYGGPFLFGSKRGAADAFFAPVATRFRTYDVALPPACEAYCDTVIALPEMQAWIADAKQEPEEIELLDMDF